ncbi:MAG: capsule biosynthesis protein [Pseudomonadota bacterium]
MPKARRFRTAADEAFHGEGEALILPDPEAPTIPDGQDPPDQPTGRQLRLARRIAQKHGIRVETDAEAVAELRRRGIDPFDRASMMQIVPTPAKGDGAAFAPTRAPLPAMYDSAAARGSEIERIQKDIVRRRRRRIVLLMVRLLIFIGGPTAAAGYYFSEVATPMYATESEFVIQVADGGGAAGGASLGGLFQGTGLATQQDSISVQGYLLSREALRRLDQDHGFTDHFAAPAIDFLQRLNDPTSQEAAYDLYQSMVEIGYDPTEGVLKMNVRAADPEVSVQFSRALLRYAEEQVDQLSARLRADQMEGAEESFAAAETRMLEAQTRVVDLQERRGIVSAEAELSSRYTQIAAVETDLRAERLRLDQLLTTSRPNGTRVQLAEQNIERLNDELELLRDGLTDSADSEASLARITAELRVAEGDLTTRQLLLQQAAQQLETARIEANRQVRYLSTSVPPVPPDRPTHPRIVEDTILVFLVFSGIYLMVSLTLAVLREQVVG